MDATADVDARLDALELLKRAGLAPAETLVADRVFAFLIRVRDVTRNRKALEPGTVPAALAIVLGAELEAELRCSNLPREVAAVLTATGRAVIDRELGGGESGG